MTTNKNLSPFNWQGPSKVIDQFGRVKSERQHLLDATRVNSYSEIAKSTPNAGIRADQIRRGGR